MSRKPDYVRKHFGPLLQKTLQNAVSHVIGEQFPRIGGPRIRALCAQMILDVVNTHVRPTEHMRHGQALWLGIATDDPPRQYRPTADTRLVPVVLDLSTPGTSERTVRHAVRRTSVDDREIPHDPNFDVVSLEVRDRDGSCGLLEKAGSVDDRTVRV